MISTIGFRVVNGLLERLREYGDDGGLVLVMMEEGEWIAQATQIGRNCVRVRVRGNHYLRFLGRDDEHLE